MPRKARRYQSRDEPVRRLADRWRPAIRKDIKAALLHLGELVPREKAVRYARSGDWAALKAHINWPHFREVLKAPFGRIIQVRHLGALLGVRKINGSFAQAGRRVRFAKEYDESKHPRDDKGRWIEAGGIKEVDPSREDIPADSGFAYHGTNIDNFRDIIESGELVTHGPDYGTDQTVWPDGSTADRSYWSSDPNSVRSFYPEKGHPVLLRSSMASLNPKTEKYTGDLYTTRSVDIRNLEVYVGNGQWARLVEAARLGKMASAGSLAGRGGESVTRPPVLALAAASAPQRDSEPERYDRWIKAGLIEDESVGAGPVLVKAVGDQFNYDAADADVQDAIAAAQDEMIAALEAQARDAIDTIIRDGVAEGLDPEDMVDDIRDLIGLTDRQAQAVLNYEDMLHNLDPQALERVMRNPDYDAALEDAIDSGESLSDTAISRMVGDYLDRALEVRAETIAQTESVRAASEGLSSAYQQAIDRGVLPPDSVRRYWQIALDEATCEICLSIPEMNPDGVGVGEPFDSIDGPQDDPPDPHPNCRCSVDYVTDMEAVPEEA